MKKCKKMISLCLSLCLGAAAAPGAFAAPAAPQADTILIGDVNADQNITPADALRVLQHNVALVQLDGGELTAADVDGDGDADTTDALAILQHTVDLLPHFPAQPLDGMEGLTYVMRNGQYEQYRGPVEIEGPRSYSGIVNYETQHIHTDMAATAGQGYDYLMKEFNFNFPGEYAQLHPEDLQYTSSGEPVGSRPYVLLTEQYMDYFIKTHLLPSLTPDTYMCSIVEPEMLREGLYGDTYKELWQEVYGAPWVDPVSSPKAVFQSQRLNIFTHTRAIETYAKAIAGISPSMDFNVAPHSTVAYSMYGGGITGGIQHMVATGKVDSVTAQVWSNTIIGATYYNGGIEEYPFMRGYLGYGSFTDLTNHYGIPLYALDDAMSDTAEGENEPYWRLRNHDQITASLMQADVNRWQFIYPDRSYANVSDRYRTEQANIHNAVLDISGKAYRFTGGTPGISLLLSDTLSWQLEGDGWAQTPAKCYYGMTTPLTSDGIPVRQKAMECITSADDLEGVTLLMVSYDCMKPLSEEVNQAIAQWVKEGGTLLYLGGHDAYETMEGEWWSDPAKGGTPLQNLLLHLGLTDCTMGTPETFSPIEWTDNSSYQDALDQAGVLWIKDDGFQGTFQGSGFETILSAGDDAVGIDCAVGKGHVVASSLSSGIYSESATGAELLRQLTRYALRYTNYRYQSADAFTARRGNYTAVHSVKGETSLEGVYVNIFDSRLSVVENPVVRQGESALYYDISSLERSIPRLVYTGSILRGTQTEEADQTVFEVTGAENALISSRIVAPQGRYPASVEAKNADGAPMGTAVEWDEASQSLLVQTHAGPDAPTTVTVRWDSAGDSVPAASHYEDFILKTNLEGEDEAFLFSNTAAANDQVRFCDLDGQLVYRFDLDQYPAAVLSLQLSQNYIVEVSPDNQDYTVVYDVSQEYDHRVASENIGMRCVVPSEYGMTSGEMYLRIRNTDPTAGWGGAISQLAVKYTVDGPSGEYR